MKLPLRFLIFGIIIITVVAASVLIIPLVAHADNVMNDVIAGGNDTISSGGSTVISYRISATGQGNDGQHGCNAEDGSSAIVTVNLPGGVTATPSSLTFTACGTPQPVTFSSSTPGNHTITVSVADPGVGTYTTNQATFTLHVLAPPDSTPPVITPNVSGILGDNGWYTSDVNVSWTVVDNESAVAATPECGLTTTVTADTTGTTFTCSATSAGGTSSQSVTIKRDATAPSAVASRTPAANGAGWNNTDVTVSFTGSDGTSGVAFCSGDVVLSGEGAGQSASGTCTDNAGNVSAPATVSNINIDKTAPNISGSVTSAPNGNGWYNSDVTVHFTCSDFGSGIASLTPDVTVSSEGANLSASGTCTDKAGNVATTTVSGINIDKTAPTASASAAPAPNGNGWNNTDVTVSFTGDDGTGSDIDFCTTAVTVSTEGAGQVVSGTCTDNAGNVSEPVSVTLNIDKTAPTASASAAPAPNANGWNNTDVTVSFTGDDALSGIDSCDPDIPVSTEGAGQVVSGTCTDNAGNVSKPVSVTLNIDKTAPTASASAAPAPNANGWNNTDVTVSFVCSDDGSGVDSTPAAVLITTEGTGLSANGTCVDKAGNTASAGVSGIKIDKTVPNISGSVTSSPNGNGWYNSDVTVHFTCSDSGSGIASLTPDVTVSSEGNNLSASGTCTDNAGNAADVTVSGINIDKTAPTASASAAPAPNANGWNNTDVTVSFSGSDGLSGNDFCDAAVVLSGEGANQSASGTCTDKAGNVSAPATASGINIDKTAPTATASALPLPNANGWNNTNVTVSFTGDDGTGSGIDTCSDPVVLSSDGADQSASGTCTDLAGNVSVPATASGINIDQVAPTVTVTGVTNGAVYNLGSVPAAGCSTTDSLSGVATNAVLTVTGGTANGVGTFTATCSGGTDLAGNLRAPVQAIYYVHYIFNGFFQPVDNLPTLNRVRAGSAIPIKFSLGGNQGLNIFASGSPASVTVPCGTTGTDAIEETVTAGSSTLQYDAAANQYIYVWKTDRGWGGTCRTLIVTFNDGTSYSANFQFTR